MDDFCRYAGRPFSFIFRYVRLRPGSHLLILTAVVAAVACSVGTQYGVKYLVDTLSENGVGSGIWTAFLVLVSLIAADTLLWRLASWVANFTFVGVTGDLRRDLFRHLTGHSPSYFADRMPGMLTSRVTATSNAVFTVENMSMWNVLPPCAATVAAIGIGADDQRADGDRPGAGGRRHGCGDVSSGGRRPAAASRLCRQDGCGRRRDGRRCRQHAAGAGILRLEPGASSIRRHDRS